MSHLASSTLCPLEYTGTIAIILIYNSELYGLSAMVSWLINILHTKV